MVADRETGNPSVDAHEQKIYENVRNCKNDIRAMKPYRDKHLLGHSEEVLNVLENH